VKKPVLAVIGRPNVGKSTLVNRILGRREAVVEDRPGVTRDRVIYDANWAGVDFDLMDTGGWDNQVTGLDELVTHAAEFGAQSADALIFIVDVTTGITNTDEALLKVIRKAKKPTLLVVNKVDSEVQELDAGAFWNLGLGEPFTVSALHGRSSGDLLDKIMDMFREAGVLPEGDSIEEGGFDYPRRVAIVGRPNVGKSSLLNQLAGANRAVVSEVSGTTRDPIDEIVTLNGQEYQLIDTAGIRRRVHLIDGADYYASLRTQAAIHKAEVALCVIDVSENIAEQDVRVVNQVVEAGRAVVLVFNKWDTLAEKFDVDGRRELLEREIEQDLAFASWAPRVNLSAKTGWHKDRLQKAIDLVLTNWDKRIPTAEVNAFLGRLAAAHPHPIRGGKQPRILFGTQVSTRPPRFKIFTNGFLEHQYRRFIENRLRQEYGFEGVPLQISMSVKEKKPRV
jgi:GTP-binding protein